MNTQQKIGLAISVAASVYAIAGVYVEHKAIKNARKQIIENKENTKLALAIIGVKVVDEKTTAPKNILPVRDSVEYVKQNVKKATKFVNGFARKVVNK